MDGIGFVSSVGYPIQLHLIPIAVNGHIRGHWPANWMPEPAQKRVIPTCVLCSNIGLADGTAQPVTATRTSGTPPPPSAVDQLRS